MQQVIYNEEMAYHRAPTQLGVGPDRVGPTIILYGTDEQKAQHLPGISGAETVWCQGFSEPGAGSDLASLQTKATLDGDYFVVNGQKIWTSLAHKADWCVLLVRTDQDAPKHKGISYLLVDMRLPGITIAPLVDITGRHAFNQIFFEDVRVPRDCLIGEMNRGWYVAAATLDFERSGINRVVAGVRVFEELVAFARESRVAADRPEVRAKLAELSIELTTGRLLAYRVASMQAARPDPQRRGLDVQDVRLGAAAADRRHRNADSGPRRPARERPLGAAGRAARGSTTSRPSASRSPRGRPRSRRTSSPAAASAFPATSARKPRAPLPRSTFRWKTPSAAPCQRRSPSPGGRTSASSSSRCFGGVLGIVGSVFGEIRSGGFLLLPIVGAPVIEEAFKPIGVYLGFVRWPNALKNRLYVALLCAGAGIVFGLLESTMYVFVYARDHPDWYPYFRYTVPVALHAVASFTVGLGLDRGVVDWVNRGAPLPSRTRRFYIGGCYHPRHLQHHGDHPRPGRRPRLLEGAPHARIRNAQERLPALRHDDGCPR